MASVLPVLAKATVLIVDDDPDVLLALAVLLQPLVSQVTTEKNPERMPTLLRQMRFDVVLLDMNYQRARNTGNEGFYWLAQLRQLAPSTAVVLMTAYGDIDLAVRALKEGARDFVVKPWRNEKLVAALTEALGRTSGTGATPTQSASGTAALIGESDAMQAVRYKLEKIAATDANVLILGENGTGKDVVARLLHHLSPRAAAPFVAVDLGAVTESLFESELFGHLKGAFTDARQDRPGRFEAAQGGTLFLDEIGNLPLPQQVKLLAVLQNRQVTRLGSNAPVPIDVRVVSATNAPLYQLAAEDRFRKDLVYRLNTIEITLPPLRERGDDVELLAHYFTAHYAEKYRKADLTLTPSALGRLRAHPFPGNVRELQHTLERAVIMAESVTLRAEDLLFSALESTVPVAAPLRLDELEKSAIQRVIDKYQGNISQAARELGITRMALYRRLGKHNI
ncbi:sigma-54-dependent transcriptional regulator [Hymenobacter nivis]|uniref:Sigma-54-dependent Fis family transcriptional regulator n=1 Tax=Hymenobacter nivis TaxID=1850093 RepID=A0A502GTV9_9BACT|nr:sigma-54 dependent transcriptional regulator [Hymenobacter nivis]TPG65361.1 sigma-54-dependent Fis family transcriptional regulator [Hymenobacter nivis]